MIVWFLAIAVAFVALCLLCAAMLSSRISRMEPWSDDEQMRAVAESPDPSTHQIPDGRWMAYRYFAGVPIHGLGRTREEAVRDYGAAFLDQSELLARESHRLGPRLREQSRAMKDAECPEPSGGAFEEHA